MSKRNLFHVPSSACVPLPLHLPLAKNQTGVSSRQQGVGVSKVSRRTANTVVAALFSVHLSDALDFIKFSLVRADVLIVFVFCSSTDTDTSGAISHLVCFRPFSARLPRYGPSQCIIPFLFYTCVINPDGFVCCKYLNKKKMVST